MQNPQTELSNVIYNAAEQAFEAKVTLHEGDRCFSYACAINAPITMSFEDAAKGLARQALRKHGAPHGLRGFMARSPLQIVTRMVRPRLRRGLPLGQYGFSAVARPESSPGGLPSPNPPSSETCACLQSSLILTRMAWLRPHPGLFCASFPVLFQAL